VPAGFRAAELPDAGVTLPFLDDFGRPPRESACECERSSGMVLGPIMKLVNGPTIAEALTQPDNEIARLVQRETDDIKVVDEVFLRYLARYPTDEERRLAVEAIQQAGEDLTRLSQALADYETQLDARQAEWEKQLSASVVWTPLQPQQTASQAGAEIAVRDDASIFVTGKNGKDVYTLSAATDLQNITGLRLEALPDEALPAGGPGRAPNGNFVLHELRVKAAPQSDPGQAAAISLTRASADFSQENWAVQGAIDGNPGTGWAVSPQFNRPHTAVFEFAEDVSAEGGLRLTFELEQQFDDTHTIGRFRLSVTNSPRPLEKQALPEKISAVVAIPADQRSGAQRTELTDYYRAQDEQWVQLRDAVQEGQKLLKNERLVGVQDLAWALINTPAFLFNR
jgi:hypothetical protein